MVNQRHTEHPTNPDVLFDALFRTHHGAVYRYCVRRLGWSEAEEAAADVFSVAWRRLDEMPDGDKARAWLFGVAYRVIGNRYRGRRRRTQLLARVSREWSIGEPHPADAAVRSDDFEHLYAALGELRRTDQELLKLSAWDGLSGAEIAQVLDIKENAVDQRLHRARARLRSLLADPIGNTAPPQREDASA